MLTPTSLTALHRIDLELGPKIGSGAQGQLFRVRSVKPPAAEVGFALIYKEFHPGTQVSGASLRALAEFRTRADQHDREVIDAMTVWPVAVVEDGSARACGYLMRAIPDEFLQHIETTAGAEHIPREIQQLFVPENIARKNMGETANRIERLALARDMAFALGFLHKRDFVYGDLSYKNAVFCLRPHPGVILLDCDAIRKIGQSSGVAQLHSPGWKPPEGGPQTKGTDRYKLGLFVLRCVTPGVNAQNRNPDQAVGHLDPEGLSLLRRALGDDPDSRTTGKEWVQYFNRQISVSGGVRQRTGAPPAPKKAPVRRAPARPTPFMGPGPRRAVRVTPSTVPTYPGLFKPLTTYANPFPRLSTYDTVRLVVGIAAIVGVVVAAIVAGVSSSSTSSSTSTLNRSLSSTTTTAAIDPTGLSTVLASSAAQAIIDAKKYLNAIDQRAVGISFDTANASSTDVPPPWVVHFAASDPDQSSGSPVWTVRNVQATNGSFVELAPTQVNRVALPTLTAPALTGLDRAALLERASHAEINSVSYVCNPANASPACDWRFDVGGAPVYFSPSGTALATPPPWTT